MLRRIVALSILIFALSLSFAFSADDEDDTKINYEVSVTADRLEEQPNEKTDSITVITQVDIQRNQWHYVMDALREVPGLAVVQSGSPGKTTSLFLRGAESAQVLVMVDGVQINDPYLGDINIENISTDNVERIEVVKGPQSPLYGSDAIAGVINIITRHGEGPTRIHALSDAGSFQTYREKAGVSGGKQAWDYSASFSRFDSQGQFENDEWGENSFSASTGYRFSENSRLAVNGRLYDAHIGIPFNGTEPTPLRNSDSKLSLIGSEFTHSNLKTRFSFTHIDFLFEDPQDTSFPLTKHNSNIFEFDFQNDLHIGTKDTFTTGYELQTEGISADDSNGPVPVLDGLDTTTNALFVQNKFESAQWIFTAGVRWDHHTRFGNTVNPRISAGFHPARNWKIHGSFGTGFRAPTAGDLAYPFYGNPDIKPEKSKSWEVGVDHNLNQKVLVSATWFRNHYDDLISFDPNTFVAGNVAKAKSQGLELSSTINIRSWHFIAAYTYLDTKDEIENHPLFRRPKNSGSIRAEYETQKWGAALRLSVVGNRFERDFSSFPFTNVTNPGYNTTDISAHYRIKSSFNLLGRIENLFNVDYEEVIGFPAPGIGAFGGVEFGL